VQYKISDDAFCLGYRMAVDCARNALLQKVVDNKEDAGNVYCCIFTFCIFYFPSMVSLLWELLYYFPFILESTLLFLRTFRYKLFWTMMVTYRLN
jgi:hypothetical protein